MAYVGTPIDTRNTFQSLVGKRFDGDGSTTAFTLDVAPSSTLDIEVFVGNVRQDPNSAYTLSGTTLTFTGAPPSGTNNIYVVHQAKAVGTIEVPSSYKSEAQTISGARTHTGAITANAGITMGGTTPTLTIGDAGAEDTKIVFDGNAQDYHIGLDDSADDLVIGKGSALGTTSHIVIDENGHVTKPLQPAFFAVLGTAQNDATGDSTAVDIGSWGTEVIDRNADFDASSGVFTAPVTGLYVIMSNGLIQGIATNHNDNQFKVISSNRTYDTLGEISSSSTGFNGSLNQSFCGVIDMDANDTVKLQIDFRSGSKVVDIHDAFKFSGYLLG
jgi:hypothetical protein